MTPSKTSSRTTKTPTSTPKPSKSAELPDIIPFPEEQLTATRLAGWLQMAEGLARQQPPPLTLEEIAALSRRERLIYDDQRSVWHANLRFIRTRQVQELFRRIRLIVASNRQDGYKVRTSPVINGVGGLGKTTAAQQFGLEHFRDSVLKYGPRTSHGHLRVPSAYLCLTGTATLRDVNERLCQFYELATSGNANQLSSRALDAVKKCQTNLIIVDDIHFLDMHRRDDRVVINHLKSLANTYPVTFMYVGVDLDGRGLFDEGDDITGRAGSQQARRWSRLELGKFELSTGDERQDWRSLLLALEQQLVLANASRGMLADELREYVYTRTTGHFASLSSLIAQGCQAAIDSGIERLTEELLNTVTIDDGAEKSRALLQQQFAEGLISAELPRQKKPLRGPAKRD
ncbi:AAA family ATPase [Streptomyces griseofuscus]|uniref:AAA family ATPase n=1 Tax=Streptomyces griseofuscus TaxID=146922 RepID=UPI0034535970